MRSPISLSRNLELLNTMFDTRTYLWGKLDRKRLPADLSRYLDLCESRGLYQAVADRLGKTRDEAKHGVMVAFYDKPGHPNAVARCSTNCFRP